MNRKGIATSTIAVLAGLFIFANIMFALWTDSPIRDLIDQGADEIAENTQYTIQIGGDDRTEKEAKEQFSDLAMFVYQRASNDGCADSGGPGGTVAKQNNNQINDWINGYPDQEGYPGLKDTYLTRFPKCYGASDSNLRNAGPQELGQDMEGIYSREKFKIRTKITLEAGNEGGSGPLTDPGDDRLGDDATWLERNFLIASKNSFDTMARSCETYVGTRQNFALYFEPTPPENRAGNWMSDSESPNAGGIGDKKPYCQGFSLSGQPKPNMAPFTAGELETPFAKDKQASITLCPGDEGYIQMNKGNDPKNDGEAGERAVGNTILDTGESAKYGYIQITKLGENCVEGKGLRVSDVENYYDSQVGDSGRLVTEVTIDNTYGVPKTVSMTVVDSNGNQLSSGAEESIGSAGGTLTASNSGFDESYCSVDIIVEADGETIETIEDDVPNGYPGSMCDGSASEYDARITNVNAGKGNTFFGFGEDRLVVTATLENTGSKGGSYYNLRMKYDPDRDPKKARFSNLDLSPGEDDEFTVRKKIGDVEDVDGGMSGCQVELQAWVEPVEVATTELVDVSDAGFSGC